MSSFNLDSEPTRSLEEILYDSLDTDGYIERHYVPVKFLGRGAFSTVLECRERHGEKSVAIKVINKQNVKKTSLDLLERESSFLQQINHPNIVGFYESRESPNKIYFILELVRGQLLTDLIESHEESGEPFLEEEIISIVTQLIRGLDYIHQKGIMHRDLKPDNILISGNKLHVKIIDFGLSFQKTQTVFITQQNCGTLMYMAPEVVFRRQYNQKVDMWSLGVIQYVLFHLGKHPIWKKCDGKKQYLMELTTYDQENITFTSEMSEQARSFYKKTAARLPEDRMSASQAIGHPWISGIENPTPITMGDLIKKVELIKRFEQVTK